MPAGRLGFQRDDGELTRGHPSPFCEEDPLVPQGSKPQIPESI
jgi:hypothetical protein